MSAKDKNEQNAANARELEMMAETTPKTIDTGCSLPSAAETTAFSLEALDLLDSSSKYQCIVQEREVIFGGQQDPTAVRQVMMTLDETDIRNLREHLFRQLAEAVPAVGGRTLCRRKPGNKAALSDDCWELGYSCVQRLLTQHANTSTLRPAGREMLPPPGSGLEPAASSVVASLETVISRQLNLERQLQALGSKNTELETRVRYLEEESTRLREESAAKDARIAQLEIYVEEAVSHSVALATAEGTSTRQTHNPVNTGGANGTADIAAAIDIRALGAAIASSLQWNAGDSESEAENDAYCGGSRPPVKQPQCETRPLAPVRDTLTGNRERSFAEAARTGGAQTQTQSTRSDDSQRSPPGVVTGTGVQSSLIMPRTERYGPCKKFFISGFRQEVSDSDVRSLVFGVVRNLHDFHRVKYGGGAHQARSKSYMIEVDDQDADLVMDPTRWPAGLTVAVKLDEGRPRRPTFHTQASGPRTAGARWSGGRPPHTSSETEQTHGVSAEFSCTRVPGNRSFGHPEGWVTAQPQRATTGYTSQYGDWQTVSYGRKRGRRVDQQQQHSNRRAHHW